MLLFTSINSVYQVFEELDVVQRSATKLKVSKKVPLAESNRNLLTKQREGINRREVAQKQQKTRQETVQNQPVRTHINQKLSIESYVVPKYIQALKSHVIASPQQKPRPQYVELPQSAYLLKHQATYNQPSLQSKEAVKSKSTRVAQPQSQKRHEQRKAQKRSVSPILYAMRLLILGIGISAIAGTLLSIYDPTTRITAAGTQTTSVQKTQQKQVVQPLPTALKLTEQITPLRTTVLSLAAKNADLTPGVFFVDLDSGAYLDINGTSTFSAASMIKVPILVAFFQDVDAGKIRLDEKLTLEKELIGGGSGEMQYKTPGTKFTALETATKMIVISDNTATNMLIARMGGAAVLNKRFQSWGLTTTQIRNLLPDLSGTNTTSPKDLAHLMGLVNQGNLMSVRSHDRLLEIMRQTMTNTLLPRGLGKGAKIAHKTGDIGSLVGDVGLVDMPNGKRYIAVAMVKRPHNDHRAQELIRQISRAAYQQLNKPTGTQVMPTTPFTTTGAGR